LDHLIYDKIHNKTSGKSYQLMSWRKTIPDKINASILTGQLKPAANLEERGVDKVPQSFNQNAA
jgi:hypothetical protein